jgi:hypothetical protein
MIPASLQAKPGDRILEKFRSLVSYIDAQKTLSVDERVLISESSNGTNITLLEDLTALNFSHPLKITLQKNDEYRVGEGYVNNLEPKILTIDKKLFPITSDEAVGFIPKGPAAYLFSLTLLFKGKQLFATYVDCMDAKIMDAQKVYFEKLVLGGQHPPRNLPGYEGDHEFYIPLAFMREDLKVRQFTMHNVYWRDYFVDPAENLHRIIFWPG